MRFMQTEKSNQADATSTFLFARTFSKSEISALLAAVLVAMVLRLLVVAFFYQHFLDPARDHWEFGYETGKIARSIAQGYGFANPYYGPPQGPTALITPVMPFILAAVFLKFGVYTVASALAILGLNSLFSALTCIPIYFIAKRCFGARTARWSAWVWALFPMAIYFSATSARETPLATFLLSCVFWAALVLRESRGMRPWLGFGLLSGLAALTNPVILGVLPFLGGWVWQQQRRQKQESLLAPFAATAVVCALIAPWLIRNYRTFHLPVFLKDSMPLELCVGNVGNAAHWWNSYVHPSGNPTELDKFVRMGEQAYLDEKRVLAYDYIKNNPSIFIRRSVRRVIYMWTGYWSLAPAYLNEEQLDLANIPFYTITTILALTGLWVLFRQNFYLALPFAFLLVLFPGVYYITHPDLVYRHPLDPFVVILATFAVIAWRSGRQRGAASESAQWSGQTTCKRCSRRRSAPGCAVTLVAAPPDHSHTQGNDGDA
jgi:4-amino-4-deoxy-L-arabinose transferase-like glycosyltransferase